MKKTTHRILICMLVTGITFVVPVNCLYAAEAEYFLDRAEYSEEAAIELIDEIYDLNQELSSERENAEWQQAVIDIREHAIEMKMDSDELTGEDEIFIRDQELQLEEDRRLLNETREEIECKNEALEELTGQLAEVRALAEEKLQDSENPEYTLGTAGEGSAAGGESPEDSEGMAGEGSAADRDDTEEDYDPAEYFPAQEAVHYNAAMLSWPLPPEYGKECITSTYGYRTHPVTGQEGSRHGGLDIAAPRGTPIFACEGGIVVINTYDASAGNWTVIYHGNGMYTEYMHQDCLGTVYTGQEVERGEWIGFVGTSGSSTGYHLHVGVVFCSNNYFDDSGRVDPAPYLGVY